MMYTLDKSGTTTGNNQLDPLWPANSSGTGLFIQNRSRTEIQVVVALPDVDGVTPQPLIIDLHGKTQDCAGQDTNHTVIDPTLAVSVRSVEVGASFTAVRLA